MRLWIYFGLLSLFLPPVSATELIHRFESPSFGGNSMNGTFLLNQADSQNTFKDPAIASNNRATPQSDIERFKASLQRAILNKVSQSATQNLFDKNNNIQLNKSLSFDLNADGLSDFSVLVGDLDVNNNISISISDGITDTVLIVPYSTIQ